MRFAPALIALVAVAACSQQAPAGKTAAETKASAAAPTLPPVTAPAGEYVLDPAHTSVLFRVSHLGFSMYTGRFGEVSGKLVFDPARPEAQSVRAIIATDSVQTGYPEPEKLDFDSQVETQFLQAAKFPQIVFRSTKVELTGPRSARVTGDLTLHGVTRPVTLETTFNGGYAPNAMDGARIGFSARGRFKRSDFGLTTGLPAPGTNMGVFDEVDVIIETEFSRGGPTGAPAATPTT